MHTNKCLLCRQGRVKLLMAHAGGCDLDGPSLPFAFPYLNKDTSYSTYEMFIYIVYSELACASGVCVTVYGLNNRLTTDTGWTVDAHSRVHPAW